MPALRGAILPAGHCLFLRPLASSAPPAASHWPQLRPPQASHWGLRIDRERSGRHKTNLTLARTNDQLLYSLNCCQEGLAHEKWSCNPLVPRIALAKVGPAPKNCIVTNKLLQGCMSSTFFGQRPLSCVTGYVNTNLSCSWLGFNLVVFSTCCCDWLFPARCI